MMAAERRGENTVAACTFQHIGDKQTVRAQIHSDGVIGLGELQRLGKESSCRFSTRYPLKLAAEASDMDQPTKNELLSHLYQKI